MNSEQNEIPKAKRCGGRGRFRRHFWKAPFFLIFILAKSGLVMLLWNALIPDLFHGPEITYLQALGLMVLAKLLVGFGRPGFGRFGGHHHHPGRGRWAHMSEEDRKKFREEFHNKWHRERG
jgi:hypothetical protein